VKYLYYPGCSLEGTALEYNLSTLAFMKAAGAELEEIDNWTCCGASAAESVSRLLSLSLSARNLALAEKMNGSREILVPCSACYLNLKKTAETVRTEPDILNKINIILGEEDLKLTGFVRVRHLLDVVSQDIGPGVLKNLKKRSFAGFSIAPYYGCQCIRPFKVFDDPEKPVSMEPLIKAADADVHQWAMGGRCCGASNMNTKMDIGIELVTAILKGAKGADAIVTVCPMCQINLEAYQKIISKRCGEDLNITVLYLPQFLGMAAGLSGEDLRLDLNLSVTGEFRRKLKDNLQISW